MLLTNAGLNGLLNGAFTPGCPTLTFIESRYTSSNTPVSSLSISVACQEGDLLIASVAWDNTVKWYCFRHMGKRLHIFWCKCPIEPLSILRSRC